jgi:site-specific recombinase XerD
VKPDPIRNAFDRILRNLGSDKSRRAYETAWSRYLVWLELEGIEVTEVKPHHVEDHLSALQEKGNKRSTCSHALSIIREVYGALVRAEIITVNPAREVKNPKFDSAPKTPHLNEEQMKKLLGIPRETWRDRRDHLVVCLLFGLGWRRAEIARLRLYDFKHEMVTGVVKGGKTLTVGVPEWLMDKIDEWCISCGLTSEDALLPRAADTPREPMTDDMVYQAVKRVADLAEVEISPHGLRRTNITLGGERGVSLKERQLSVGHRSQSTTERYDHARDASKNAPGQVFADLVDGGVRGAKEER